MSDRSKIAPVTLDLLNQLVTSGPIVTDDPGDPMLSSAVVEELAEVGLVEVVRGANRSMIRATFAGRRMIADWRDDELRKRGDRGR